MPCKTFDDMWVRSEYMWSNFNPEKFRHRVELMEDLLLDKGIKFDCIACRGVSGLIVAAPVAFVMDKPMIVVRKSTEGSHSGILVEGYLPKNLRYIVVDDFLESGDTISETITQISNYYESMKKAPPERARKSARCVGVFLYSYYDRTNLTPKNKAFFKKNIRGPIEAID